MIKPLQTLQNKTKIEQPAGALPFHIEEESWPVNKENWPNSAIGCKICSLTFPNRHTIPGVMVWLAIPWKRKPRYVMLGSVHDEVGQSQKWHRCSLSCTHAYISKIFSPRLYNIVIALSIFQYGFQISVYFQFPHDKGCILLHIRRHKFGRN